MSSLCGQTLRPSSGKTLQLRWACLDTLQGSLSLKHELPSCQITKQIFFEHSSSHVPKDHSAVRTALAHGQADANNLIRLNVLSSRHQMAEDFFRKEVKDVKLITNVFSPASRSYMPPAYHAGKS